MDINGVINQSLVLSADTSFTFLGNANDLVIPNLDNVSILYIDAQIPGVTWGGLQKPLGSKKQLLQVTNTGINGISILRESVSSLDENRFYGAAAGFTLSARSTIFLQYETATLGGRWRYF